MAETDDPTGQHRRVIPIRGWKFRFDSPPPEGVPGRADEGDIFALFAAWEGETRAERRDSPRYQPAETQVFVGWWKGAQFLITQAALINLSRGGALVELDCRPPTSQPVWVCLGTPYPIHHVQARALEVSAEAEGCQRVRLLFHTPCPFGFFRAAGRRDGPAPSMEHPEEHP